MPGDMREILDRDATAQADLIRRKEITPAELVEQAIGAIERVNPQLNAVVTPMFDAARRAAAGHLHEGPLRGVPFLLKDAVAAYKGVALTSGSALFAHYVPDYDSELVRRYKRAGLIVVGKTNLPELGTLPTTEPRLFGPCHNPWDPTRTPGGSSGGSAAAVAARLVPMAHANDGGGSIRIPASCCGVFGLKPTRARNPLGPRYVDFGGGLLAEHAVTRSVRDCAALLDATAGPDTGAPYWAPPPERPFAREATLPPGRLRIGFSVKPPFGGAVHGDCIEAVRHAAALLVALGHDVEERDLATDPQSLREMFLTLWTVSCAKGVATVEQATGKRPPLDMVEPLTWAFYERAQHTSAVTYQLLGSELYRLARQVARFFKGMDVWLTPTLAEPPVPLGTFAFRERDPLGAAWRAFDFSPFTPLFNTTGQPAASLPLFWNEQGLPIGVQLVARFGAEATLLRLAAQLEQACPWDRRRPQISA